MVRMPTETFQRESPPSRAGRPSHAFLSSLSPPFPFLRLCFARGSHLVAPAPWAGAGDGKARAAAEASNKATADAGSQASGKASGTRKAACSATSRRRALQDDVHGRGAKD